MIARWEAGRVASSCWESITAVVWSQIANTNTNTVNNKYKTQTNTKSAARAVVGKCIRRLDQVRTRPG